MRPRSSALTIAALGVLASLLAVTPAAAVDELEVEAPPAFLTGIPFTVTVTLPEEGARPVLLDAEGTALGEAVIEGATARIGGVVVERRSQLPLRVAAGDRAASIISPLIPGWVTILPPLVAVGLALIFREVVTSLFAGVWLGCLFVAGYNPFTALLMTVGRYGRHALVDSDHSSILIFSLLLGGMVGIVTRTGSARAIVDAVSPMATSRRRGLIATMTAGLLIFFDDYTNTLIVGNTMRPLTDRLKISREKLAYIVDSTAAPVAALFFVSTWVGFEISLIGDGLGAAVEAGAAEPTVSPFAIFIHSIPQLYYPLFALLMVAALIVTGRDFGPMLAAERRALSGGGLSRPGAQLSMASSDLEEAHADARGRWWMAALPVLTIVVTVVTGLVVTGLRAIPEGSPAGLSEIFGNSDPFTPLLWGSLLGCVVAVVLSVGAGGLSLTDTIGAWVGGMRAMLLACVILVLAWSLGDVTESLGTASFLSTILSERLPVALLPVCVFVVAALISFGTGTSWGTMAILFPLVVPLVLSMGGVADPALPYEFELLLGTVSAVMAGALFGDHCSPISDTTVMSSMASACDHVDHVRTQLPYALLAALIAALLGAIPTGYGLSPSLALLAGSVAVFLAVRFLGRRVEEV